MGVGMGPSLMKLSKYPLKTSKLDRPCLQMFLSLPAPQRNAGQLTDNCNTPGTARERDLS